MRRKEKENYIYNLIYQFVSIAYPLMLTPYTARIFSADGVGDYSYTVSIVTIFTLILSCMGRYGFREVSYCNGDKEAESKVFWEVFLLKTIIFVFLLIGYIIIIIYYKRYRSLFLAQLISLFYAWLEVGWYWQGRENFKFTAMVSIANKIILLISVFLLIKDKSDLSLYAFIVSFVTCIGSVCLWPKLIKRINKPGQLDLKKHIKNCALVCLPFIIIELYSSVDKTMIGLITQNSFENGYYEQTIKITKMVMVVLTSMSLIKAPRHTALAKMAKTTDLRDSLYESFSFMLLVGSPITFGLCAVADICVPIFLGNGYEHVITLIYLYSPFMILHGLVDILANQYFIPIKRQNQYTLAVGLACIVNVVLNCFLIKWKGAIGAIIATVLSEVVSCAVLLIAAKDMISIKKIIKENYLFIFAAAVMFIVCLLIKQYTSLTDLIEIVVEIIIGAIVYILMLLSFRQKYFMSVVNFMVRKK